MLSKPESAAPAAARRPVTLTSHEHTRIDPYHWLRDDERKDPAILDYLRAENAYKDEVMAPGKALTEALLSELKGRVKKDDRSVPSKVDSYWYYTRYEGTGEYPIHCRRPGSMETGAEEVLLDVNAMAKGQAYFAVGSRSVSHGEQLLAWAEDTVSRRIYTIRFKDLRTGEVLADRIEGTSGSIAWAADDRTLFYVRRDAGTLRAHAVYRRVLGSDPADDVLVFDETDDTFWVTVRRSKSKAWVLCTSSSTLQTEVRAVDSRTPEAPLTPVIARQPKHEYSLGHHGDHFYVVTNKGATNFRLVAAPVATASDESTWREVIPARDDVLLVGIEVFDAHLAIQERHEARTRVRVMRWSDGDTHTIEWDDALHTVRTGFNPAFDTSTLRLSYSSPITPPSVYEYDMSTRARTLRKQDEVLGGFDPANYGMERTWATATDGTRIPISVIWGKGWQRDGARPLFQYAYGAYGISVDPTFNPNRISLLDRGFAVALAHVRGGQEMGRPWYEAGKLKRKENSFTDFVDSTRHLVAERYAHPDKVVCEGGSAGGLLIGAVLNLAPELYAAAHAAVPFVDVVSTMLDDTIPLTTFEYDEWGNPNVTADYHTMLAYSPYDRVCPQSYPHLLVTTGLHDSQVQYWEPAKWVAKLRATALESSGVVVLDTDMSTGHGGASGRFVRLKKIAESYAFFLRALDLA